MGGRVRPVSPIGCMDPIFIVDAIFRATRPIRSLPAFHGARWSAWLRFACGGANFRLNEIVLGLLPLRNGQQPIRMDETLALRLVLGGNGPDSLPALGRALGSTGVRGEFSRESMRLLCWKDAVGGAVFEPGGPVFPLRPLSPETVGGEIRALRRLGSFTLRLSGPLRLKLPPGAARSGREIGMYCPAGFFSGRDAMAHLLAGIRLLGPERVVEDCPEVEWSRLAWEEMRYSRRRGIALGGVAGGIGCAGCPGDVAARRLVLGQYLGAGKNPLFGLGYWRIPELDGKRRIGMEERR